MCAKCQNIFAADVEAEEVTCPACDHTGAPGRVMQVTGFPDMETFTRNWKKAKASK